ncbi:FMN-binding negative transcriptional regulator [Rhodocytophaga rosea]|uniref:FMN-binding negative transcriptional regulator n=1 Tax=Rhodocytophaga rosea TaxID=2704465 RepID=A0A6C0GC41_9BACT|nr:FMN-binding negative transcriptional regulator [Rhodocytophaga rosea]QHT65414.1 FMN-binding negative transcriptional regulator [Rhodocytophaga rosea]
MYINKFNLETNFDSILPFLKENNFGILVTATAGHLVATHIPFEITSDTPDQLVLRAHLAKANKQWKQLSANTELLVIFQGPNAYISPRWYDHINVPTMNYIAVHAYGKPRIIEDSEEVYAILKSQIESFEKEHVSAYNITTMPESFLHAEMRALVALEIKVERVESNFKLSQNRDEKNYRNIIEELEKRNDAGSQAIASHMKIVYAREGYKK